MQLLNTTLTAIAVLVFLLSFFSINGDMRRHNTVIDKISKLSELDQMTMAMENKIPVFHYEKLFPRLLMMVVSIIWIIIAAVRFYKTGSLG